jgi:hypothetical protein
MQKHEYLSIFLSVSLSLSYTPLFRSFSQSLVLFLSVNLIRIRILGSVLWITDPNPDPSDRQWLSSGFFAYYFL